MKSVTSFRFMSKNEIQGWKFSFLIFSNHVFWRQFKGQKVGGGGWFFHFDVLWGGRWFFLIFIKKSCHYVLWGKSTFFENRISNGMEDIFFCFFFKKVVIIYYGENKHFLKIWFAMGWTIIFLEIKFLKCVDMYYGENTFFL